MRTAFRMTSSRHWPPLCRHLRHLRQASRRRVPGDVLGTERRRFLAQSRPHEPSAALGSPASAEAGVRRGRQSAARSALMKTPLATALFVIALSVPGLETWQAAQTGGAPPTPNPAAGAAAAAAGAAHRAQRSVALSRQLRRPRRTGPAELLRALRRRRARHQPVVPPSRRHRAEVRHRRSTSTTTARRCSSSSTAKRSSPSTGGRPR